MFARIDMEQVPEIQSAFGARPVTGHNNTTGVKISDDGRPHFSFAPASNRVLRLWLIAMAVARSSLAQSVLSNGSFEDGGHSVSGWHALAGGTVRATQGHQGQRCLHGKSPGGAVVWESERLSLHAHRDDRLEGGIRCRTGEVRLSIDLLDDADQPVGHIETPRAAHPGWRYVAAELNATNAVGARVTFWVKGEADL